MSRGLGLGERYSHLAPRRVRPAVDVRPAHLTEQREPHEEQRTMDLPRFGRHPG